MRFVFTGTYCLFFCEMVLGLRKDGLEMLPERTELFYVIEPIVIFFANFLVSTTCFVFLLGEIGCSCCSWCSWKL